MKHPRNAELIVELGLEQKVELLLENQRLAAQLAEYKAKEAAAAALAATRNLLGFTDWTQLESFVLTACNGMRVHVEPEIQCHVQRGWSFINTSGETAYSTKVVDGDAELQVEFVSGSATVRGKIEHKESTSDGQSYHITNKLAFQVLLGGKVTTITFVCSGFVGPRFPDSTYEVVAGMVFEDEETDPCSTIRAKVSYQ